MSGPVVDLSFRHRWEAEILPARPAILPARRYVYPREVEEIERGALEVLIRPTSKQSDQKQDESGHDSVGPGFSPDINPDIMIGASAPATAAHNPPQPFLATCAVGFLDPAAPTGIWSCPNPREICAVSGGYAYLIDTTAPERFTMLSLRPVMQVQPAPEAGLLLFAGHHSILAWSREGLAWQSAKLSDEGLTITGIEGNTLHGIGWQMMTDKETPFKLDLETGLLIPG